MKIKELLEELYTRNSYKEFNLKYPDNYFSAGFFILGNDGDNFQLNFFIKGIQKNVSFEYPFCSYKLFEDESIFEKEIKQMNFKIDLDNLKDFIESHLNKKIEKIIAIIKEDIWNITCINGLSIIKIEINALDGSIINEKNSNMSDFMRIETKK